MADIRFESRRAQALWVGISLLAIAVYAAFAGRMYLASHASKQLTEESLKRAVRLEPGNAEYHSILAQYDFQASQDTANAVTHFQRSVALNPYSADTWLELASVYQVLDDRRAQSEALGQALWADPRRPDVVSQAAMYHLLNQNVDAALPLVRVVLSTDSEASYQLLEVCWKALHDVDRILAEAIPPAVSPHVDLLHILQVANQPDAAWKTWQHLQQLRLPYDGRWLFFYVENLIGAAQLQRASEVWNALPEGDARYADYRLTEGSPVNGGFEHDILNGGFDWHVTQGDHVSVEIDTRTFHGGSRSLALQFDGGVPEEPPGKVFTFIPVEGGKKYRFTAYVMSAGIESASGPRIWIGDAYHDHTYYLSDDSVGSTGWMLRSFDFTTEPGARLLKLQIVRQPPDKLISGRFNIDDVTVAPISERAP